MRFGTGVDDAVLKRILVAMVVAGAAESCPAD